MKTFALVAIFAGGAALALLPNSGPSSVPLGRYATPLEGRTPNQRHNATLAMRSLEKVVIQPGETFSFVQKVGSFSRDRGYRRAPVSYNGTLIKSWGGGVCQTSTTVYNAALLAGLEIVERSHHRFSPSYVPPGRDAAVAYDAIDLKVRNPYSFPVTLHGSWNEKTLEAEFSGKSIPTKPRIVSQIRQFESPARLTLNTPSESGRIRNTGKAGYEVATYRYVGSRRELISLDRYPSMPKVVEYD